MKELLGIAVKCEDTGTHFRCTDHATAGNMEERNPQILLILTLYRVIRCLCRLIVISRNQDDSSPRSWPRFSSGLLRLFLRPLSDDLQTNLLVPPTIP